MTDLALPYSVTVRLTTKMMRNANAEVYHMRQPAASFTFLVALFGMFLSIAFTVAAMFHVAYLGMAIKLAQGKLVAALAQPGIAEGLRTLNGGKLAGPVTQFAYEPFSVLIDDAYALIMLAVCLPAMLLLALLYNARKGARRPDQTFEVTVDTDGMRVTCGATHILHGWSAISSVKLRQPVRNRGGLLMVELDYGAVHVWPQDAFADQNTFLLTGHRLSAMFLSPVDPA